MTLPATGPITMAQVAHEVNVSQTGVNLDMSVIRALAGASATSGSPINMGQLRGQTGRFDGNLSISGAPTATTNDPESPFFGDVFIGAGQTSSGVLTLAFQSSPHYSGAIQFTNNTTGGTARCTKVDAQTWQATSTSANILTNRTGNTDSFTLVPTT